MSKSRLYDYSDASILVKRIIAIEGTSVTAVNAKKKKKKENPKNCVPFTDCMSEINNTEIDNTKDIDVVMSVYSLIEYSDNYSKSSGGLWLYCRYVV